MKEISIKVRDDLCDRILSRNPVIEKRMLKLYKGKINEGDIIKFTTQKGKFLARGYYGIQNKGFGWILSYYYKEKIDEKFFKKCINKAISKRNDLHVVHNTDAYRLFNAEGDGIGGLSIDRYGQSILIQWYSRGIYKHKDVIVNILKKRLPTMSIFEKKRFGEGGKYIAGNDFVLGNYPEEPMIVSQNGIKYVVDLDDGAMTGLFLDQRNVRSRLRNVYAKDKHVLNLFSYTGAFGVAAKLGGAMSTTNVDIANRSIELTRRNYEANNLEFTDDDMIVMDVFSYISWAVRNGKKWDVVILDPPSFSRSKKKNFTVENDYMNLAAEVSKLLSDKGVLIASTNYSKWSTESFVDELSDNLLSVKSAVNVKEVFTLPDDFCVNKKYPLSDYLKVAVVQTMI